MRGRRVKVPAAVRATAEEKVGRVARYLRDVTRIEVDFEQERNPRVADKERCEIRVHARGTLLTAGGAAAEPIAALDQALDRAERQARRLHERRVTRTHPKGSRRNDRVGAAREVVDTSPPGTAVPEPSPTHEGDGRPRIVRVPSEFRKPMSPEEAALQLDALEHDFFLFHNAQNGQAAVIYRRRDGGLGLIEAG